VVTIGKTVANRGKLNWWESRALYGWTVLVPRTKDQAGEMSEKLVSHGALPIEVPTIAVEPPRSPRADGTCGQGSGRRPVSSGWCSPPHNAVRAVWEKFNEFRSGRPRVLGREDRMCRAGHGRPGAGLRDQPRAGAVGETIVARLT